MIDAIFAFLIRQRWLVMVPSFAIGQLDEQQFSLETAVSLSGAASPGEKVFDERRGRQDQDDNENEPNHAHAPHHLATHHIVHHQPLTLRSPASALLGSRDWITRRFQSVLQTFAVPEILPRRALRAEVPCP